MHLMIKIWIWWYGLDSFSSLWEPVTSRYEYCNKSPSSIKIKEFIWLY